MLRSLATLLVAVFVSGSLIGCAGVPSVSATASDRAKILTVRIDPKIEVPEKPFYYGPTQTLASLGGAIGAALAANNAQDEAERIAAAMRDQHTEINDIVLAEFPKAWEAATPIRFTNDPSVPVDGIMTLKIQIWGLGQAHGLSPTLYPDLGISATLKRPDGTVAWQRYDFITPANRDNTEGHKFDEFLAQPELLKKAFDLATDIVSKMLLQNYQN